jgi:hypothetical protein
VFAALYAGLGVVDFVLMRRYARVDPPQVGEGGGLGATAGIADPTAALTGGGR